MKMCLTIFCITLLLVSASTFAHASEGGVDAILAPAECLFKAMQQKDYVEIWAGLSEQSRETIAGDTWKALKASPGNYTEALVAEDFAQGGVLARSYWDAYLQHFDPAMVLEDSRWEMGPAKGDRAQIVITYKKAEKPATLHMVREAGMWKVGLTESFWSRK